MQENYDVTVTWRAFPFSPETPVAGESIADVLLRKGILMSVEQMVGDMQDIASAYDVPFGDIKNNYNTRLMQEVGLWAQEKGRGLAFQAEGLKANFVTNENVSDTDVLLKLVSNIGLDSLEARLVIEDRLYSDAVDADWQAVQKYDIVAAPTHIIENERLVGAQSYQALEKFVVKHGAQAKVSRPKDTVNY